MDQHKSPRSSLDSEACYESKDGLLDDHRSPSSGPAYQCIQCKDTLKSRSYTTGPWLLSLVLLISLLFSTTVNARRGHGHDHVDYGFWKASEFATVKREIPAFSKQVQFDGKLKFNETHQVYRPVPTDRVDYAGAPSPEVDAAWEELLGAVDVFVTPEEGKQMGEDLFVEPETGLHLGMITVFHDLHCLDVLRKSMHLDYYEKERNQPSWKPHVEHCLDSLRMSLMCTGDMTFVPIKVSDDSKHKTKGEAYFETVHTCRDYDALRKWSIPRDAFDPTTRLENAERLRSNSAKSI